MSGYRVPRVYIGPECCNDECQHDDDDGGGGKVETCEVGSCVNILNG